jgi:hypothetical protein
VLNFCQYDKYLTQTIYREEKFVLAPSFRGFHPRPAFRIVAEQHSMEKGHGREKLLTSWQSGSREEEDRSRDQIYLSVTCFQ